jgi:hypothetical protein
MRGIIAGGGLAIGLLGALSACVPAYYPPYPAYPAYYARPASRPAYQRAPSQPPTGAQTQASDWVNPDPAR